MIKRIDTRDEYQAKQIVELQRKSYKIEAELIGFDGIPPLKEDTEDILNCDETFYGYFIENVLAGVISYKIEDNILDIHRVAVHPEYFRRGIARQLLKFIVECTDVEKFIVSTGEANLPAVKLYESFGFCRVKSFQVAGGLNIVAFEKVITG